MFCFPTQERTRENSFVSQQLSQQVLVLTRRDRHTQVKRVAVFRVAAGMRVHPALQWLILVSALGWAGTHAALTWAQIWDPALRVRVWVTSSQTAALVLVIWKEEEKENKPKKKHACSTSFRCWAGVCLRCIRLKNKKPTDLRCPVQILTTD